MDLFHYPHPIALESGGTLPELTIAYTTYGLLNAEKSNVVWVCHALTANADAADWWKGVVGPQHVIDPKKYFIICANILGSCYGTSGPLTINSTTGKPYYHSFPIVTIRDMVKAHILLRQHLGIEKIALLMGGSMGGYQALEWSVMENNIIEKLFYWPLHLRKVPGALPPIRHSASPLKRMPPGKTLRHKRVPKV